MSSEEGHCSFHAEHNHHQRQYQTQSQDNDDIESCSAIINMEIGALSSFPQKHKYWMEEQDEGSTGRSPSLSFKESESFFSNGQSV